MRSSSSVSTEQLVGDIRTLIESTRERVAQTVNASLVMLYWSIGRRIRREIGARRAAYGEELVSALSKQLAVRYCGESHVE